MAVAAPAVSHGCVLAQVSRAEREVTETSAGAHGQRLFAQGCLGLGHAAAGGGCARGRNASAVWQLLGEIHQAAAAAAVGESWHRPCARGAEMTTCAPV